MNVSSVDLDCVRRGEVSSVVRSANLSNMVLTSPISRDAGYGVSHIHPCIP